MAKTFDDLYDIMKEMKDVIISNNSVRRNSYGSKEFSMDEHKKAIEEIEQKYSLEEELRNKSERQKSKIWEEEKERIEEEYKLNEEKLKQLYSEYEILKEKSILNEDEIKRLTELEKLLGQLSSRQESLRNAALNAQRQINTSSTLNDVKGIVSTVKNLYSAVKTLNDPWAKADHAASKFVKTVGMAKDGMDMLRKQSLDNVALGFGVKYNISSEELLEAQTNYIKGIGRNISISDSAQESMAAMRAVAGSRSTEIASQFENFGISLESTGDHIGKMFSDASKHGLSFDKYSENVVKNIRIAQNYTFKDGLKGLENMAKKATAIKLDMQQVANFADKVNTVEGSIETAAKLQVLGGPFASMADPMGMLNESLNDMEGFQDRIVKIYGQMGQFNRTTGEVEVSAFNKQRLRAYAEATGQDYSSIMESVHTAAKRDEILKQINGSNARGLDNEMKELIANTATFKDGKAGVSIKGQFKGLNELTNDDKKILEQMNQNQSEDIKQIAMDLRSLIDLREGTEKQKNAIQAEISSPIARISKGLYKLLDFAGSAVMALGTLVILQQASNFVGAFKGLGGLGTAGSRGVASRVSGWGTTALNTVTGGVFRRGASRAGTRIALKIGGRNLAAKLGGTAVSASARMGSGAAISALNPKNLLGGGIGTLLSIGGMLGNHYTDKAVAEGKIKAGSGKHKAAKMGSQALQWGGTVGGLATLIGGPVAGLIAGGLAAGVGAVVGRQQAQKYKNADILDKQLNDNNITRQGDYGARKLRKIDDALQTGELSDRMRRKLIAEGDIAIVKEIEKVKEKKENAKAIKKRSKINVEHALISIKNGGFGNLDLSAFSDVIGGNEKGGTTIKGKNETGKGNTWEEIKTSSSFDKLKDKTYYEQFNKSKTYDININGSLKLTSDNGQSIDIINILRKNPQLLRTLSDMIAKEIGVIERGVHVPQKPLK